jgi:hypothetical protein
VVQWQQGMGNQIERSGIQVTMKRIDINKIEELSAYKLSHLASSLVFVRPNLRGQQRPDKTKKAVLRALCDRYPNVWPSLADMAAKASCSVSQAQRVLRELERKDRLIVDISTVRGKKGGRGAGCTAQYFVLDRKILDIVQQQKYWANVQKTRSCEDEKQEQIAPSGAESAGEGGILFPKPGHARTETRSYENVNSVIPESNGPLNSVTMTDEPIRVLTEKVLTSKVEPASEPSEPSQKQAAQTAASELVAEEICAPSVAPKRKTFFEILEEKLMDLAENGGDEGQFKWYRDMYLKVARERGVTPKRFQLKSLALAATV